MMKLPQKHSFRLLLTGKALVLLGIVFLVTTICGCLPHACPTRLIEIAVKMVVAALTAFLTALTTTSCMGHGPIYM